MRGESDLRFFALLDHILFSKNFPYFCVLWYLRRARFVGGDEGGEGGDGFLGFSSGERYGFVGGDLRDGAGIAMILFHQFK